MRDLKTILLKEIEDFKRVGYRFCAGELSIAEFKKISGGFGVYAQRGAEEFMIRLRIPSGVINSNQLNTIYKLAEKYKLKGVHLTTRQAIQFHGLSIDDVCDIMREGILNDIYTRGAGGNYPRNVAMSPLAGVDPTEAFDVTPYAMSANMYFLKRICTYILPRKLKVNFNGSLNDSGHVTFSDLGFYAVNSNGKNMFQVYVGGGLGRNPELAFVYPDLIEPREVLYYIEAMVNLFIEEGDYENKGKARIRFIPKRMGQNEFIESYKKHVDLAKERTSLDLNIEEKEYDKPGIETKIENFRLFRQKQRGLYSVYIHPIGGQLSMEQFKKILELLDKYNEPEINLSMTEGLYIRNLNGEEAEDAIRETEEMGGNNRIEQSVACIGASICQMGIGDTQQLLKEIIENLRSKGITEDLLPKLYISGCPNSCGVHEVGNIGLMGKMKKIDDLITSCFEVFIGGNFSMESTRFGESIGDIKSEDVKEFIFDLAKSVKESNMTYEKWIIERKEEFDNIIKEYTV